MKRLRILPMLFQSIVLMLALVIAAGTAGASGPAEFAGKAVRVGEGVARVVVATDAGGAPESVSVVLTGAALEGLPQAEGGHQPHPSREYILPMPTEGPETGYDHVGLDWNPAGHIPEGVYSVPHFDVHFYLVDQGERQAITFRGGDRERALAPPVPELVPAGYVVPPDTGVERMGLHGVDPTGPEFSGKPFTHAFLYGYHAGRLVFVEPMVTLAYLQERGDVTVPVKTPAEYTFDGHYPTKYRVGYDVERDEHRVALLGLHPYTAVFNAAK